MKKPLPSRDSNILSAYLDDEISPQERARLEDRLQQNPDLRGELEALRRTRLILRAAPKVRAPRNFTLTPEMVAPHPSFWGWFRPTMQWSAAVAFVLLLMTIAGQRWLMPPTSYNAEPPAMMMAETAFTEVPAAEDLVEEAHTAAMEKGIAAAPTTGTLTSTEMTLPWQSMMQAEGDASITPTVTATTSPSTPPTAEFPTERSVEGNTPAPPPPIATFPWRSLQIALGVTAILSALAAFLAEKRQ